MEPTDLMMAALVAIVCGTLAQLTSYYSRGGWIVNLGVGFAGALLGMTLSRIFNAPAIYDFQYRRIDFPVIYSFVGSALLLAAMGFVVKSNRR